MIEGVLAGIAASSDGLSKVGLVEVWCSASASQHVARGSGVHRSWLEALKLNTAA